MKSSFLKIAVFAITLCCTQVLFGQSGKVVCYDYNNYEQVIWIDAPYFSGDLITEVGSGMWDDAFAWITWNGGNWHKWCLGNCGYENIGRHEAGGIDVNIACRTAGYGSYAVAEVWAEW